LDYLIHTGSILSETGCCGENDRDSNLHRKRPFLGLVLTHVEAGRPAIGLFGDRAGELQTSSSSVFGESSAAIHGSITIGACQRAVFCVMGLRTVT